MRVKRVSLTPLAAKGKQGEVKRDSCSFLSEEKEEQKHKDEAAKTTSVYVLGLHTSALLCTQVKQIFRSCSMFPLSRHCSVNQASGTL